MKSINLSAVDLNLLVAFEALIEQRSVTQAAEQLQVGQPAMSASLNRLRVLFGDELFVRLGRQMQPTLKAQALAPGILGALGQIRQSLAAGQGFDPGTSDRTFSIGSSDYTSFALLPPLLALGRQVAPSLNLQMVGFEKDSVGDLLEQGAIDIALGVFPDPPRQSKWEPIFEERFVGVARQGHPGLQQGGMDLDAFTRYPHALTTLRRDSRGEIDKALAAQGLERRLVLTTPHMLVLPFAIASSDLITALPRRVALRLAAVCNLATFELPIETQPWTICMLWSTLSDQDDANRWLRESIKAISQQTLAPVTPAS